MREAASPPHPGTPGGRRLPRWFWGGFIAVLLIGVLLAVFASIRGARQWATARLEATFGLPTELRRVIRVTLEGAPPLYLDQAALPGIQARAGAWLDGRREATESALVRVLDAEITAAFAAAEERIPDFAD